VISWIIPFEVKVVFNGFAGVGVGKGAEVETEITYGIPVLLGSVICFLAASSKIAA
jgi:hypothetical protein